MRGLVAAAAALGVGCTFPPSRPADHVVLISIDGFRAVYAADPAASGARMPHLAALAEAGAVADGVVGVYPSDTYPSHTTLVSGVRPARHGIVSNTRFDPERGSSRWVFDYAAIRVPTLWNAAREAGLTTGGVSWPVTVGAPIDVLFPETSQLPRETTWLDLAREQSTPGLIDAVVEELGGFGPSDNRDPLQRDRFSVAAARHIIREHAPALLAIHLMQTDPAQHGNGPHSPEAIQAFENVDVHLGEILAAIDAAGLRERTAVVVTGDHGFLDSSHVVRPNQALLEAGLHEVDAEGNVTAWQAAANEAAIRIADPADSALAERVVALFDGLAAEHPEAFRVVPRAELDGLGADPDALLFLEPAPGYAISNGHGDGFVAESRPRGIHGPLPTRPELYAGLALSGSGITPGVRLGVVPMVDVAPTIARLLGLSLEGAEGAPLERVLTGGRR